MAKGHPDFFQHDLVSFATKNVGRTTYSDNIDTGLWIDTVDISDRGEIIFTLYEITNWNNGETFQFRISVDGTWIGSFTEDIITLPHSVYLLSYPIKPYFVDVHNGTFMFSDTTRYSFDTLYNIDVQASAGSGIHARVAVQYQSFSE